ncbi:DUF4834 family protein [Dysgonomonas macrotermitis]|uniref:DUF4834 domain-containing protein n=1 Tax=Dysgonomonas macrotermitis TaxID=1346286 RepID=A0A1M5CZV4_9BACT|nr:DUF4834 family protein [Dysgonomonas macrotermitis]SHF60226.1 protein of unknown function [Dysgonomonas macrotermitis]
MGSFLLFILVVFLLIIGLGFLFILRFLRIFTKGTNSSPFGNTRRNNQQSHDSNSSSNQRSEGKVFGKDEGEYIDYEEIK